MGHRAGGNIGSAAMAKAPADGYTRELGTIDTRAVNAALDKTMPYDPEKDFSPMSRLAIVPNS